MTDPYLPRRGEPWVRAVWRGLLVGLVIGLLLAWGLVRWL
jgi:high-affinity Fe2+/Pb2+ permease